MKHTGPAVSNWVGTKTTSYWDNPEFWSQGLPGNDTSVTFTGNVGVIVLHTKGYARHAGSMSLDGTMTLTDGRLRLANDVGTALTIAVGSKLTVTQTGTLQADGSALIAGSVVDRGVLEFNAVALSGTILASGQSAYFYGDITMAPDARLTVADGASSNAQIDATGNATLLFEHDVPYYTALASVTLNDASRCDVLNGAVDDVNLFGSSMLSIGGVSTVESVNVVGADSDVVVAKGSTLANLSMWNSGGVLTIGADTRITGLDVGGLTVTGGTTTIYGPDTTWSATTFFVAADLNMTTGVQIDCNKFQISGPLTIGAGSSVTSGTLTMYGGSATVIGVNGSGSAVLSGEIEASSVQTTLASQGGGTLVLTGANMDGFLTVGAGHITFTNAVQEGHLDLNGGVTELAAAACTGATVSQAFSFGTAGAILQLDANPTGGIFIDNFQQGSTIDLTGFAFSSDIVKSLNGDTLTLSSNGTTAAIMFGRASSLGEFQLQSDGHGGTEVRHPTSHG